MERVGALISKLKEQYEQKADVSKITMTVQMLLAELQQQKPETANTNGFKKVSVVMPLVHAAIKEAAAENGADKEKKETEVATVKPSEVKEREIEEPEEMKSVSGTSAKRNDRSGWMFDVLQEVPTLAHQNKGMYELNEAMAGKEQSLNERLRVEKLELGNTLKDAPIKDLKKAIGINDRYLFINELFRGDETMYERSIKTINSFNILAEAEYWIQRELKLKIGWKDSDVVAHFDQLVRRRFS